MKGVGEGEIQRERRRGGKDQPVSQMSSGKEL